MSKMKTELSVMTDESPYFVAMIVANHDSILQ